MYENVSNIVSYMFITQAKYTNYTLSCNFCVHLSEERNVAFLQKIRMLRKKTQTSAVSVNNQILPESITFK